MSFRLDRLLTLYLFGPLARLFPSKKRIRIPILMYHSISDGPETGHPYFWINTPPARFAEHMKLLHDNGYQVIPLSYAVDLITGNAQRGTRNAQPAVVGHKPQTSNLEPEGARSNPVVLTFDDGYQDFYTHAFPILRKNGFTATIFLPTAFIGSHGVGIKGKKHMTWVEIKELLHGGMDFGAHTVNHLQLKALPNDKVEGEIKNSKEEIEKSIGKTIDSFSFPYTFPAEDQKLRSVLADKLKLYGFRAGVTTTIGCTSLGQDPIFLARIPVNGGDDERLFKAKLDGSYEWMRGVQLAYKLLKG